MKEYLQDELAIVNSRRVGRVLRRSMVERAPQESQERAYKSVAFRVMRTFMETILVALFFHTLYFVLETFHYNFCIGIGIEGLIRSFL